AHVAQDLQPVLAESLETVRAGSRLEGAAAKDVRARLLDLPGDLIENASTFHGTRPGDHRHRAAADTHPPHLHDSITFVTLTASELERLEDGQHLLNAGNGLERLGLELVLIADDADDGAVLAAAEMGLETQLLDALQDVVDLLRGGLRSQNDNHDRGPW